MGYLKKKNCIKVSESKRQQKTTKDKNSKPLNQIGRKLEEKKGGGVSSIKVSAQHDFFGGEGGISQFLTQGGEGRGRGMPNKRV